MLASGRGTIALVRQSEYSSISRGMRISVSWTTVSIARLPSIPWASYHAFPDQFRSPQSLSTSFSFACLSTGISIGAQRRNIIEVSHLAPTHPVSFRHIGCLRMTIGKVRHIMALSLRECSNSVPVTCIARVTVLRLVRSNLERNILSIIFQNGLRRS